MNQSVNQKQNNDVLFYQPRDMQLSENQFKENFKVPNVMKEVHSPNMISNYNF